MSDNASIPPQADQQVPPPPVPASYSAPAQPYLPPATVGSPLEHPQKSFLATWLLSWLLGTLGIDRFYLGKVGTGILKLITFGGFGIWWLVDLILVLTGATRDRHGRPLAGYDTHKKIARIITAVGVVLSIVLTSVSAANAPKTHTASVASAAPAAPADSGASDSTPSAEPAPQKPTIQSWADTTYGTFTPITQTGSGDGLITLPVGAKAGIVAASYQGDGNFAVSVLDAANTSTGELLVNTIGAYTGTTAYGFNTLRPGVTLQVSASASWSITIAPVSTAPALATSGSGDAVFLYDGSAGQLLASHDGSANFVVSEQTGKSFSFGLLINEIGAYSGTVPLTAGPAAVSVQADGNWTFAVK